MAFSGNSEDAVNSGLDNRDVGEVCHDQEQLELHQDAQKARFQQTFSNEHQITSLGL